MRKVDLEIAITVFIFSNRKLIQWLFGGEQMHLQQLNVSLVTDADFENRTQDYEINIMNIYNSIKQCLDEGGVKYNNLTVGMSRKSYGEPFKNIK